MNNQPVYWKMKNGKSIDIDLMDINHLRNVLKMIVRNSTRVPNYCPHNIEQATDMQDLEQFLDDSYIGNYDGGDFYKY